MAMENLFHIKKKYVMVLEVSNVGVTILKATKIIHSKHISKHLLSLTIYFVRKIESAVS